MTIRPRTFRSLHQAAELSPPITLALFSASHCQLRVAALLETTDIMSGGRYRTDEFESYTTPNQMEEQVNLNLT